jgi:NhaP-type Na+/H+ or K+/H+ antiporter
MFEMAFGLVVGACIGYGVRSFISHHRRVTTRRRLGMT